MSSVSLSEEPLPLITTNGKPPWSTEILPAAGMLTSSTITVSNGAAITRSSRPSPLTSPAASV
jgi:hypothetical protein